MNSPFSMHDMDQSFRVEKGTEPVAYWPITCTVICMKHPHTEGIPTYDTVVKQDKGLGPNSAGQSGDTQGLPGEAEAGDESVLELVEEGQFFEADVIDGVEQSADPDVAELHTRQVSEEDVPDEYLNNGEQP
jgi:hypothetical protein